jgi:serine/threonine protein kinase
MVEMDVGIIPTYNRSIAIQFKCKFFTFNELMTENEVQKPLGEGTFGKVYESDWEGKKIPIKNLNGNGSHNQGAKKSFISKEHTLGSIQHVNLVQLFGYYIQGTKHILVYKYMSNSSIHKWLFDDKSNHLKNWHEQMHIIIGIVNGLAYLNKCNPMIFHLNIKRHNILLDTNYTPKLADFGLVKILDGEQCKVCVTCHNCVYFVMILYMCTL